MEKELTGNKRLISVIYAVSAIIPIAVAFLIFFPSKFGFAGDWVRVLPSVHALVNSLTVITLLLALVSILKKRTDLHKAFMFISLGLGVLFLISYIIYHSSVDSVKFGDFDLDGTVSDLEKNRVGSSRTIYLVILLSHILFSIGVVPLVLFAFYYALTDQIMKHRRIVKFTYPIWMYVSITGVIVFLMIKPFYP